MFFARMMDRHLWRLLGRLGGMTNNEFDDEAQVTSEMMLLLPACRPVPNHLCEPRDSAAILCRTNGCRFHPFGLQR